MTDPRPIYLRRLPARLALRWFVCSHRGHRWATRYVRGVLTRKLVPHSRECLRCETSGNLP